MQVEMPHQKANKRKKGQNRANGKGNQTTHLLYAVTDGMGITHFLLRAVQRSSIAVHSESRDTAWQLAPILPAALRGAAGLGETGLPRSPHPSGGLMKYAVCGDAPHATQLY